MNNKSACFCVSSRCIILEVQVYYQLAFAVLPSFSDSVYLRSDYPYQMHWIYDLPAYPSGQSPFYPS